MSLRAVTLLVACSLACSSGSMKTRKGEPQTAREKMLAEQKANPEEGDATGTGKKWGRWRYHGERKECFFVFGAKCFKTENAACQAARCKAPLKCLTEGAGPTTLKCGKGEE